MSLDNHFFNSISLDENSNIPLYVQLYQIIYTAITTGQLAPGYKLPPIRKLAKKIGINPGTIVNAYRELAQNGYIFSREGSGSIVAERPIQFELPPEEFPAVFDYSNAELPPQYKNCINMRSITLNPEIVSTAEFKKAVQKILERDEAYTFCADSATGYHGLRESLSATLTDDGIKTTPESIQIISGSQQGIDIIARTILSHGDHVITESPTYPGALAAFRAVGARVVGIPLTKSGIDIVAFEKQLKLLRPKLIYVMPNLQNPTGITYDTSTRSRLIGLARYYDTYVLEDDYLSGLYYASVPPQPLKALDTNDHVIYLRSFSPVFMPGLRLAFIVAPQKLIHQLSKRKKLVDLSSSGLTQKVLDLYLREGIWPKHLANIRHAYEMRFAFTCKQAKQILSSQFKWQKPTGGLSLWLELPNNTSAHSLTEKAEANDLLITDGGEFFPNNNPDKFIRLSFANLTPAKIEAGLTILNKLL